MPRVLRVFNRFIIGGPVLNAMILSRYLAPEFETRLITGTKEPGEQTADNLIQQYGITPEFIPEMRRSILPTQDAQAYRAISRIIKEFKPDIVHTHAAKAGAIGRLAAHYNKVPVILHTFHGHTFHSYFNKYVTRAFIEIERNLARKSSKIIAISQMQKDELVNEFKICSNDKIVVIPNGIDLTPFTTNQEQKRAAWRSRFNLPQDAIVVGIVGRMAPIKNHAMFVNMAQKLMQTTNPQNLYFAIIGDGETREATQALLQEKNIPFNYFPQDAQPQKVIFTSWQTQMDEVYAGLDVVCLNSLNEGTPISVIEAQAAAKPVVSTHVGAVADTLVENETGFLIENFDVDAFAARVETLVNDPQLRTNMGQAGRAFVLRTYSHLRLVSDMRNLYNSLLSARS